MADLIDRDALMADIATSLVFSGRTSRNAEMRGANKIIDRIKAAPTVDVEPVRHGRWEEADWFEPDCHSFGTIRTPKAALRCSNCKHCFKKELLWKDNYCPNCGARMDEEEKE